MSTKQITVHSFAQLKDYFAPRQELQLPAGAGIPDLLKHLEQQAPESSLLLANCRLATEEEMIDQDYPLHHAAHIYLYPPSSGG